MIPELLLSFILNYTDIHGRMSISKPGTVEEQKLGKYASNNANLYTGEMAILLQDKDLLTIELRENIIKGLNSSWVEPGLMARHPGNYRETDHYLPVSHDEYNGLMFAASVIPELRYKADDVVEYGKKNNWQYCDVPGYKTITFSQMFSNPNLFSIVKNYLNENHLRRATKKYPELFPIFFTYQPHQRFLFKALSTKYKPTLFEEIYFAANIIYTSISKTPDNGFYTRVLAGFRLKALENVGYSSPWIKLASTVFVYSSKKMLGENYLEKMVNIYFDDKEHPFHYIVKHPTQKYFLTLKK